MKEKLKTCDIVQELELKKLDWFQIAAELIRIRDGNLWRDGTASSWSSWVRQLGKSTNRHPEGLFKMISAYTFFQEIQRLVINPNQCQLSMDNLILLRTITSGNHQLASRLYNDVVSKRYSRKHLKMIKQHVVNVWEPERILRAVKRGEMACLMHKSRIFERYTRFVGRLKVRNTVFDAVVISPGVKDQNPCIHGIKILLPGERPPDEIGDYGLFVHALWIVTQESLAHRPEGSGFIRCDLESETTNIIHHPDLGRAMKKNELLMQVLNRR